MINWSFSKLSVYESCAYRYKLQYIEKLPQLPLKPDNPMERGNRIHNALELYVKSEGPIDCEAKALTKFEPALTHLQELYSVGMATAEDNWWFDTDWNPIKRTYAEDGTETTDKSLIWLWSKLDLNVTDETELHVITGDYKSGKSGYKTIEHVQQIQLYVAVSAIKYPWAEKHTGELWYVDEGWVRSASYTVEEALRFVGRFDSRAQRIYNDKLYRPNPNIHTCRYCPFGKSHGTGACAVSA